MARFGVEGALVERVEFGEGRLMFLLFKLSSVRYLDMVSEVSYV